MVGPESNDFVDWGADSYSTLRDQPYCCSLLPYGWVSPTPLTIGSNRTVIAQFAQLPLLHDLPDDLISVNAEQQLAARGISKGCDQQSGLFCPTDPILHTQMTALIMWAMGWLTANSAVPFSDRGPVDDELWQAVGPVDQG